MVVNIKKTLNFVNFNKRAISLLYSYLYTEILLPVYTLYIL